MARRSLGSTFNLSNLFNKFWTSAVALLGSTRRSCAITHPHQINHCASCLVQTTTRQAAKWCPSTVGKKRGSRLQLCRVTARHPRDVNEDYELRACIDDEWVYVPARKNKVVQCNEEDMNAEIDEGCVEDLKKKKCVKRTASELEESELATPEGGKKKRRG